MATRHPLYSAPCHLQRIDAPDNIWRFYTLTLAPDLFGGVTLVREWGRIGQDGTVRRRHFTDEAAAVQELNRIARRKIRRGYRLVTPQALPPARAPANRLASPERCTPPAQGPARSARQALPALAVRVRSRPSLRVARRPPQASPRRQAPAETCRG